MAADMTDETIAQYMERIEKMSIKEIQKEIEFLESPGYNCEGLVCADGVITPRTKMHRKVLWYKRMNQKSLTALQWAKEGYVVNPDATGRKWKNNPHNSKAIIYYVSDEVHEDKDPERWGDYYNEGDLTNCFKTIEDVIELAKQVFRLRFTGEWEFYVESPYNKYRGKLEINV